MPFSFPQKNNAIFSFHLLLLYYSGRGGVGW